MKIFSKHTHIGGQAVLEGVMLRGKQSWVVSVRKKDHSISEKIADVKDISKKYPILGKPVIRGVVSLYESVALGIEALNFSARESSDEEVEISNKEIITSFIIAILLSILVFIIFPSSLAGWVEEHLSIMKNVFILNIFEGILRVAVFVAYVVSISLISDIRRVFQYHGAEHKVIHAFEEGIELEPENVEKFSTAHMRCGTSFILIVLILMIVVFSFLGRPDSILVRIVYRIVLVPVIAGLAYEVIKMSNKYGDTLIFRMLVYPGMLIQRLTTREPDRDQIEVAINSLKRLLSLEKTAFEES